jgi:hypothetical protein
MPAFILVSVLVFSAAEFKPGESAVRIPVGTKITLSGESLVFVLPEGRLELGPSPNGLLVRTFDPMGKPVYQGSQARLFAECSHGKLVASEQAEYDLRFIRFVGMTPQPDLPGKAVIIPKGTKIERVSENQVRFLLGNGERVEFKCGGEKREFSGDCGRYDRDGKLLYGRSRVKLCRSVEIESLKGKTSIEDEPIWIQFFPE